MLTPYNEDLFIGCRFADRYHIIELVGKGSMGVVYKARHELMGRFVAIKMLRGQLQQDERSVKRFEREARAASRLDHPNVIIVHDFGLTEHRQPYLVMDFASGVTLYQIEKREGRMPPERAVHIFSQVCDALHHAHIQGVIHRDLKPSNIMVMRKDDDPDFVKVFDLGIAKIAWGEESEKEDLTNTGEVCGSPVYLSPEQCKQEVLDHRTDIYSLGVVMYELLTGVPPLMGETVYDTIYLHVNEQAPRFAEVCDLRLPTRLEQVVLKALQKDPAHRQQSMQELKLELVAALSQSMPPAPDMTVHRRPPAASSIGGPSTAETLKDEIRALRASVEMIRAVPGQQKQGSARPEKKLGPVATTAILSSVISIVATLAVLAMVNISKPKAVRSQQVEAKPPTSTTRGGTGEISAETTDQQPLRGAAQVKPAVSRKHPHDPKAQSGTAGAETTTPSTATAASERKLKWATSGEPKRNPNAPTVAAESTKSPGKPSLQAIAPKIDDAALPAHQDNGGGFNPFFSIFQQGKSGSQPKAPTKPRGKGSKLQSLSPVMAPEQGSDGGQQDWLPQAQQAQQAQPPPQVVPQQPPPMVAQQVQQPYRPPVQQVAPSGPTLEEQQQAVVLNNEAVGILTSEPQAAIEKLNRALKLNPSYTKARIHLGNAYHNLANQQRQSGSEFNAVANNYRLSLNILRDAVGAGHPAYLATKQDYENFLQTAGARSQ